jgi:hypothetical protein
MARSAIRTINLKFAGKCACCGGDMAKGELADYWAAKRQVAHYKAWDGDSAKCYGVLKNRQEPYIDIDRAYEDQCADICGH